MPIARLHLITPQVCDDSVVARTRAAVEAGARWIQVRFKDGTDRQRWYATKAFMESVDAAATDLSYRPVQWVVDDRADFASALGAGVHVGAEDVPVTTARRALGPDTVVGATCRNAEEAKRAQDDGASYLGVGPVYATSTKDVLHAPIGPRGIEAVARAVSLPVIAIAGITVGRVPELVDAGAYGVAVVSAVYDAPFVGDTVRGFLRTLPADPVSASVAEWPARGVPDPMAVGRES